MRISRIGLVRRRGDVVTYVYSSVIPVYNALLLVVANGFADRVGVECVVCFFSPLMY